MTRRPRVLHVATVDLTLGVLLRPQLLALRESGYDVWAMSAPGPWVEVLRADGIGHIAWRNATRAWDPAADLRAALELTRVLRRERFDVVHTHSAKPGVMGRIGGRIAGTPLVCNTVHGFDATPEDPVSKRALFMSAEWLAARFSDLEFYQGREDLARARRLRMVPERRAVFLGNGTDLSRFDPSGVDAEEGRRLREGLGIPADAPVVGMVGRLVGEKGYRELFAAAATVRQAVPGVRFLVVGQQDPDKADAIGEDEMAAAGPDFTFAGWRQDVVPALAAMDVFALPSWREGVPRSAIEAAAMGLPLVLSDIPGCRQVARDGVEGLLVPARRPDQLAEALTRVLKDPDLRTAMGAAARRRAAASLDERTVVDTLLRNYRAALSRKTRRRPVRSRRVERVAADGGQERR